GEGGASADQGDDHAAGDGDDGVGQGRHRLPGHVPVRRIGIGGSTPSRTSSSGLGTSSCLGDAARPRRAVNVPTYRPIAPDVITAVWLVAASRMISPDQQASVSPAIVTPTR